MRGSGLLPETRDSIGKASESGAGRGRRPFRAPSSPTSVEASIKKLQPRVVLKC